MRVEDEGAAPLPMGKMGDGADARRGGGQQHCPTCDGAATPVRPARGEGAGVCSVQPVTADVYRALTGEWDLGARRGSHAGLVVWVRALSGCVCARGRTVGDAPGRAPRGGECSACHATGSGTVGLCRGDPAQRNSSLHVLVFSAQSDAVRPLRDAEPTGAVLAVDGGTCKLPCPSRRQEVAATRCLGQVFFVGHSAVPLL